MARRDEYYNKAKQQGYRSRSAYKLQQLDETADLFTDRSTVIELGAAPGGWLQVAAEHAPEGRVVGADRQRIEANDGVETRRGGLTDEDVRAELKADVGGGDVALADMGAERSGEDDLR